MKVTCIINERPAPRRAGTTIGRAVAELDRRGIGEPAEDPAPEERDFPDAQRLRLS